MSRFVFKLPDLGEGTVEAEIVGWRVKVGDTVREDDVIVEVMTDKAAVEVPAPVSGKVLSTTGTAGDMVPVGAELIVFETEGGESSAAASPAAARPASASQPAAASPAGAAAAAPGTAASPRSSSPGAASPHGASPAAAAQARTTATSNRSTSPAGTTRSPASAAPPVPRAGADSVRQSNGSGARSSSAARSGRVATSPAIRRRAHEAGVDLKEVEGSGPHGRIVRADFEAFVSGRTATRSARGGTAVRPREAATATEEIKVIGLRRLIAQRMSESKRNIPHFAYVEEIDVTELESLRRHLNSQRPDGVPALTYLPFLVTALVRVLPDFPQCNALYDAERGVIVRHRAVHVGLATQTPDGLKVPVVRNAETLPLWDLAARMREAADAARTNKASREALSGSTITVTSLGKLGGIASTPIINAPEVSIIGVNRAVERPMVHQGSIAVRLMMNLSSSFDHRFVDGHDAAALIQALKERLEHPATLFIT